MPPQKKNRRRGAFHCFCSPPRGGKTPGWNTNPLHWPATTAISIKNALFSVPLFHFSATDNSRLLMMRDNPSDIIPTRLWRRSRRPFRLNTQAWCDRQTDRQTETSRQYRVVHLRGRTRHPILRNYETCSRPTQRVQWRHGVYGYDMIAILWV